MPFARAAGGFGVGAFPLSRTVVSMWLFAGNQSGKTQPVLLVYFSGPENWHEQKWESKFDGNSQKDEKITYRLVSHTVTLEIAVSADRKSVWVQGREFDAGENNIFAVKSANDPQKLQVESLGHFVLPSETEEPLAAAVLRKNPALKSRLE